MKFFSGEHAIVVVSAIAMGFFYEMFYDLRAIDGLFLYASSVALFNNKLKI